MNTAQGGQLPTVVVPVFNAFRALVECLDALAIHSPDARIVFIDDGSDDARIAPLLAHWTASRPATRVITLPENLGFVHAANRGMAAEAAVGHDVILLNSDTVVTGGWLAAMARCLASASNVATATPWSNNAEIVSVPRFCAVNPVPEQPERWARAARSSTTGRYPELPTAVGFCMGISRRAIGELGLFDEAAFGRGYGEENDFSCRATAAGWRNVLCEDAYVVHQGGQSFGPLGLKPGEHSMRRLLDKHPNYLEQISAWIEADPLADRRQALLNALEAGASGTLKRPQARD
ncbi:MAG: glycosyltransferase family 2 protein [Pseudomonadota bacterium]